MPVGFNPLEDAARRIQAQLGLPSPPAGLPTLTDEVVIKRQLERKQRLATMQGRGSTFLTGPAGIYGPPSEIARAFLLAKMQQQPDFGVAPGLTRPTGLTQPPPPPRPQPQDLPSMDPGLI